MNNKILFVLSLILVFCTGRGIAQDFDPVNPPEPNAYYKLTTTATPAGYASGAGSYLPGTNVQIRTSGQTDFVFLHWTKNGEYYTDQTSFTFIMPEERVDFVAVYEYDPSSPQEPSANYSYRLYLSTNIPEACSFNRTSGAKVSEDTYVNICAYKNADYDFEGWFENNLLITTELSFNYHLQFCDARLEARFVFNPTDPDEPTGNGPIDIVPVLKGDVNADGTVDTADKVLLINHFLNGTTFELDQKAADANKDGAVDIGDAVEIINIYLNNR